MNGFMPHQGRGTRVEIAQRAARVQNSPRILPELPRRRCEQRSQLRAPRHRASAPWRVRHLPPTPFRLLASVALVHSCRDARGVTTRIERKRKRSAATPIGYREDDIMIRALTTSVVLLAAGFVAIELAPRAVGQTGPGWVTVTDGKTMGDFTTTGDANWRVEDGAIVADKGKGGHLVSKNSYKNFQIYAEFWADEEANSGIFIRCKDPAAIGAKTCYEVNIFDKRPDPSYGTGAIVYFAEVNPMPKAAGKWNTYEITADGRHLVIVLNGQKTADIRSGMFEEGHFTLQYGAGTIKFRKVAVKPM